MKQVYDYQQWIYIKGHMSALSQISFRYHLCLLSLDEFLNQTHKEHFQTFEELFKAVQEDKIWNANAWYTCILKRPIVRIVCGMDYYYITKRNFTEVHLAHRFEEKPHETMETLMKNLKADDFAEYLQERKIEFFK